ncbi:MAG: DNA polymerase [Armatimonadota bacterium]|nr:DNA polymerase [Armatimonadota bacterium]
MRATELKAVYATYHPAAGLWSGRVDYDGAILADLARALQGAASTEPCWTEGAPDGPVWAVDTEWAGDGTLLTWAATDGAHVLAWDASDGPGVTPTVEPRRVWVYYGAEDVLRLTALGLIPGHAEISDLWWLVRLVDPRRPSYTLESLAVDRLGLAPWKWRTPGADAAAWDPGERRRRCMLDSWVTWHLAKLYAREADTEAPTYARFLLAYGPAYWRLAWAGMYLVGLDDERRRLAAERARAEAELRALGLPDLTPRAVRAWLYETLGLAPERYTPAGLPSVDRRARVSLRYRATEEQRAALERYEAWAQAVKALQLAEGAYRASRPSDDPSVVWTGAVLRPLGTATGRRAAGGDVNTQNWPKWLRTCVRSRWPGGAILSCDYVQLEPRILAALCGSPRLRAHFGPSGEGYVGLARELWGRGVEKGSLRYRAAKAIILGCHYGMGPRRMADELWATGLPLAQDREAHERIARRAWRKYHELVPELDGWIQQCATEAARAGSVPVLTGRRVAVGREEAQQAANAPVQGLASDITAAALLDVEQALLDRAGLSLREWSEALREHAVTGSARALPRVPVVINEVHDALVVDCPPEARAWVAEVVPEVMRQVPSLRARWPETSRVPLDVDPVLSEHWV